VITVAAWTPNALAVIQDNRDSSAQGQSEANLGLLQDFAGNDRMLAEYAGNGNWLVVMLWASGCRVSNQRIDDYNDFYKENELDNLQFIGVSVDGLQGKADAQHFIDRHDVQFPNLLGELSAVSAFYTVLTGSAEFSTPSFLVFSPSGELVAQQAGAVPPEMIERFIKSRS
jgi:peroxiredoxin